MTLSLKWKAKSGGNLAFIKNLWLSYDTEIIIINNTHQITIYYD